MPNVVFSELEEGIGVCTVSQHSALWILEVHSETDAQKLCMSECKCSTISAYIIVLDVAHNDST